MLFKAPKISGKRIMNILLLFPPMLGEERYGKLAKGGSYLPPLGLAYIAAVLEKEEHTVDILDGSVGQITTDELAGEIRRRKPGFVGISAQTPSYYRAVKCAEIIKQVDPKIVTAFGGPHPTALPFETVSEKCVDFVIVGEGEYTTRDLVAAIEEGRDATKVKGLWHKDAEGKPKFSGPRERIANLDELPWPARHLLDWKSYKASSMQYKQTPAFSMMCGRGCHYGCTFCDCSKVFGRQVTIRSPESVASEVAHLVEKYGAREVTFWDDTFCIKRDWVVRTCELLKPFGISWSVWSRVNTVDKELLKTMADAGCWNISFGIEAGTQKVLDTIKKGITLEQAKNAVKWCHETGIEARTTWILGLPGDTWESMMKTVDFAIEIDADYAQFQLLTVYPNTELWTTWKKHGKLLTQDWSKYTIWHPVFVPNGLTEGQLKEATKMAYRKFYLRPSYMMGRLMKMRGLTDVKRYLVGGEALLNFFTGNGEE